jgi:hypothetical protein
VFGAYLFRWLSESKEHSGKVSDLKPILIDAVIKNIVTRRQCYKTFVTDPGDL